MVLADPLKREDVAGSLEATVSPSSALNAMVGIALDDTAPPVGPPTPDLPALGVANSAVALPVSPVATDDRFHLLPPLREDDPLALPHLAPLPEDPVAVDNIILDIRAVPEGEPVAAATSDVIDPLDADMSVAAIAWLVTLDAGGQASDSSDEDVLFAPGTARAAPSPAPLATRFALSPKNLMLIARAAFGRGQAGQLVPALLSGFDTDLSYSEIHDRLRLLWLMRKDVATLVRAIIVVGQAHCKPPGEVLMELLGVAQQYTTYTD